MRTIIFDTETTDLVLPQVAEDIKQPRVVEFYALVIEEKDFLGGIDFKIVQDFEFYARPDVQVSKEAQAVHGIDPDTLSVALPFVRYAGEIAEIWRAADRIVAHNLDFDRRVLDMEFARNKLPHLVWPDDAICTIIETKHIKSKRMKLAELYEHFTGEVMSGAHKARHDVHALYAAYQEMRLKGIL